MARRSSSLRDARRHLWEGRSDRSRGEKLWPLTATQPTFRLKPSRSIGSGAGSSATKAERAAEFRRAQNELERAGWQDPGVAAIPRELDAGEELDPPDLTEGARLGASVSRECSPSHEAEAPGKQRVILAV